MPRTELVTTAIGILNNEPATNTASSELTMSNITQADSISEFALAVSTMSNVAIMTPTSILLIKLLELDTTEAGTNFFLNLKTASNSSSKYGR